MAPSRPPAQPAGGRLGLGKRGRPPRPSGVLVSRVWSGETWSARRGELRANRLQEVFVGVVHDLVERSRSREHRLGLGEKLLAGRDLRQMQMRQCIDAFMRAT